MLQPDAAVEFARVSILYLGATGGLFRAGDDTPFHKVRSKFIGDKMNVAMQSGQPSIPVRVP
jgi:hypothetical protein